MSAAIAAGAIAGLMGGWFKLGWDVTWSPRTADRIAEPSLLVTMFTHMPTALWESLVIQFAFSILAGVAFGALVESFPFVEIGAGVTFGVAIWIGGHEIVMPLIGLTPPTWALPLNEQASEFCGHALWGVVIAVFYTYLRRRFVRLDVLAPAGSEVLVLPIAESIAVY